MRVEPYTVGSIIHVVKRGARGLPITRDDSDKWRFARLLYFANDEYRNDFWERETLHMKPFDRPNGWPARKPLVSVLAWTLMPNHFHLLLKENHKGGVSTFMQKLCGSMSMHFNTKYKEKGSMFQGAYKSRTVDSDAHLCYLAPYIMAKNVCELYPAGIEGAAHDFDRAWDWAVKEYPFSSLPDYVSNRNSPIISNKELLAEVLISPEAFKTFSRDVILGKISQR